MSRQFFELVLTSDGLKKVGKESGLFNQSKEAANNFLLAIPSTREPYFKVAIECIVNLLSRFINNTTLAREVGTRHNQHGIPMEIAHLLIEQSRLLGYIVNSTSWSDKKLYDFDYVEINQRLKRCLAVMQSEFNHEQRKEAKK